MCWIISGGLVVAVVMDAWRGWSIEESRTRDGIGACLLVGIPGVQGLE